MKGLQGRSTQCKSCSLLLWFHSWRQWPCRASYSLCPFPHISGCFWPLEGPASLCKPLLQSMAELKESILKHFLLVQRVCAVQVHAVQEMQTWPRAARVAAWLEMPFTLFGVWMLFFLCCF